MKNYILFIVVLTTLAVCHNSFASDTVNGRLPDGIQRRGFGVHASLLAQMDGDASLERAILFSAHNGHYPRFDIFKNYYAVIDETSGQVQYLSDVVLSTGRDLVVEDRSGDGIAELHIRYIEDEIFTVDAKGENFNANWVYETIETTAPPKVVIGYIFGNHGRLPDPFLLTHLNYAFGHVTDTFDGVRLNSDERLREVMTLKRQNPALKILVSIGGWGSGRFSEMAADENYRLSFARDCKRLVDEFGLDGIDIDWEYPTSKAARISAAPEDRANFTLLMRDIRAEIGNEKLLTLATVANAGLDYIDFRAIDPYIDLVNMMTYDMDNSGQKHHSGLYRSPLSASITTHEATDSHLAAGVPLSKLVMGVPFYGRGVPEMRGYTDYRKIVELEGYERRWDDVAMAPYLVDPETGRTVAVYDDVRSLTIKTEYIKERGMRGIMYWAFDDDTDDLELSRTIYYGLYPEKRPGLSSFHENRTPVQTGTIKTLIITGQDGSHWWRGGSGAIELILENSGAFEVDMAITPPQGDDMSTFTPDFGRYDLVVINYAGDTWSAKTRKAFERFVKRGGGVMVVHSSIIPMADWKEYNRMTGLGAWGGRDEKDGPWVYWKDGACVRDTSPGPAGHHGLQHPFTIVHRVPDHPILRGLPPVWEHFKDELYGKARGPAENMEVLATTLDEPARGGSGRHEPMLWTVAYGRGRVFVTAMGHAGNDPEYRYSMECAGFQETLLRGAEWAATGGVTRPVPADLPSEGVSAIRPGFKTLDAVTSGDPAPVKVRPTPCGLIITNTSDGVLAGGWQLGFCGSMGSIEMAADSPVGIVSDGNSVNIYSTPHYNPLLHGESLEIQLREANGFTWNPDTLRGLFFVTAEGKKSELK